MFGAYKIQLPMSLQMRLQSVGGAGWGGSFLAGIVAGIIAAPCTGPVIGAALTYVATTGNLAFGFLTMFTFAIGMGMLFIAIGTFSTRIVPKSGAWLGRVESIFGIAMLVVALYFLKDVIPPLRDLMRPGTTAFFVSLGLVVVGLALGAVHKRFASHFDSTANIIVRPSWKERISKGVGVALVVVGLYGAIGAFIGPSGTAATGGLPQPKWIYDEAEGRSLAQREGRPMIIDAYADWCVACRELDMYTFSDQRVLERLEDFVTIKLDFTNQSSETRALQQQYGIVGLPTVIFLDSSGNELVDRRLLGFESADRFLARLEGIE
jgi:thioredoxin:protein disulfide reductase